MSGFEPRIKAVLGPTNTGKTHLAVERLLAHSSGIIGFPLRLLARENYDRMVARKGAGHVALITGEEKIVPPTARWFSCTVEAMPLDRPVEFVAVDEIQLCADPDRGHIFTDRLLHARGLAETIFLGSETIAPLLRRLTRKAEVDTRPRLSRLTHAGPAKLTKLPPRTAIVAFSAADVYAIAELIRRRRGGCAVVMGRLSPRTRNAQVALYQDKEVDFLVATDAIGMGLNMDVDHVAFAGISKHDGHRIRRLTAAEVAQIAGRAGRGMRDGTFGTTATCPDLPDEVVARVEDHRFEMLEHLCWRNSDLDFSDVDALLASLSAPPPERGLVQGEVATDFETLAALAREPEVRRVARGRRLVRLLWQACQIPDFRKLADETHNRLCARIFFDLAPGGQLSDDWLRGQMDMLARPEGDIDTLMQRLAGIRVWSYITARTAWVRDAPALQARARAVEDLLSDALHERLIARFVDRRAAVLMRRLDATDGKGVLSAVTRRGEVVVEGHPVGTIGGFTFHPDPTAAGEQRQLVLRAARRALHQEMPRRVTAAEGADDEAFAFGPGHTVLWNDEQVARLRAGESPLHPQVVVLDSEFLDGAQRERLRRRLQRWLAERVRIDLAPLFEAMERADANPALRGPLHRLQESLGVIADAARQESTPEQRRSLKALGVRAGRFALFLPALLKPRPAMMRARLWAIREGIPLPALPAPGLVSVPPPPDWPEGFAAAMGWLQAGPVLVRLDVAERVSAELGWATRSGPIALPPALGSRFSVPATTLPAVLHRLGFRVIPAAVLAPDMFGPPAFPTLMAKHSRRKARRPIRMPIRKAGPFAALATLVH